MLFTWECHMTPLDGKVIETANESFDHKQFRLEKEYYMIIVKEA